MKREVPAGVIEGQTLTADTKYDCDVCIIGSGAGGAVAAATLQNAGLKVIVLEEGGYFTSDRFRMLEEDSFPHLYQEAGARTTKDGSMVILQGKAVGGTTVVNWTTSFRTPERVLDRWKSHHDVNGFDYGALEPHWDAVEKRLSIARPALEVVNRNNRLLYDGCKKLGYEVDLIPRNVKNCLHTGYCGMGCPVDAKQSMLVSYLPDAMNAGATVVSRVRVERFVLQGGKAVAVEGTLLDAMGRHPTGVNIKVRAPRFILAAGAMGSPAVLMRSGAPDPHKRLGIRTFLHPVIASMGLYDDEVNGFYGAPQSVASHQFYDRGDEVGYLLEAVPVHPSLLASAIPDMGEQHREWMEQVANVSVHLALTGDGLHDDVPGGKVELRDNLPTLDYVIADRTWQALRHGQKEMAKIFLATGAREVITFHEPAIQIRSEADIAKIDSAPFAPRKVAIFSAHVMGGCGMSDDPKKGVVRSEDGRHHQIENLHIIDGSTFPTSLGVNPQETIYGIARLLSTRLAGAWA